MIWVNGDKHRTKAQRLLRATAWICALYALASGVMAPYGNAAAHPQESGPTVRLVTAEQGRQIAAAALDQDEPVRGTKDCSHLVHQVYSLAGYEYAYASSFDLYAGNENFRRVRHPQAGDLVTWPGHVGIVIDSRQHSFHSLVRSGLQTEDYLGPYWRSRGRPRFYRYVVDSGTGVETARATRQAPSSRSGPLRSGSSANAEVRAQAENASAQEITEEAALRSKIVVAPKVPASAVVTEPIASSILITPEQRRPTAAEAFDGISQLSSTAASTLRTAEPFQATIPIVIFDELHVERVETKRDKGWIHLQIESHVRIADAGVDFKRRREKVRWELRRDASGWTAIAPVERAYVARDGAVRVLSAQLAEMAASDAAARHDESLVGQEARIVNLLGALLEKKQQ
jgi:NlpC/P60 family